MKSGNIYDGDRFVMERCEISPAGSVDAGTLFEEYAAWCRQERIRPARRVDFEDHVKRCQGVAKTWQGKAILTGIRIRKGK